MMNAVWAGKRLFNLDYLIMAERLSPDDVGAGAPTLRIVMVSGTTYDLGGEEAEILMTRLMDLAPSLQGGTDHPPVMRTGVSVDPQTGVPLAPMAAPRPGQSEPGC